MRVVFLAFVARVVFIGLAAVVIGNVIERVHRIITRHIVLVVVQRGFGLGNEVRFLDRAVRVFFNIEVGEYRNSANLSILQKSLAVDVAVVHRVADIFQDRRKTRRACTTKDGTDDKNPVVGVEIGSYLLEFFRILELVQHHAPDVGIAHKTDVHFHVQQIHFLVALVDGLARKQNIG
ncbi:hypothetical protein GBK04_07970 [Cytophagaceae bacterium SJW1-29]|uniref:Uncharacterized protein n=1 Tax=Salmonirosea aquatica TaxID=2654236 RepID=A0A7C9BGQ8_9BACT|nr:hypothetical protein [Cytophagaceae bacterium SJW1-29]